MKHEIIQTYLKITQKFELTLPIFFITLKMLKNIKTDMERFLDSFSTKRILFEIYYVFLRGERIKGRAGDVDSVINII